MDVEELITKLKTYEIASADGTAIAAANAIKELALRSKAKSTRHLFEQVKVAALGLRQARQSSAALHNCLDFIEDATQLASSQKVPLPEVRDLIGKTCDTFVARIDEAKKRIAEIGAKRIRTGDRILTLCRSTTVLGILRKVVEQGKQVHVFVAESRPDLEGRLLATEVAALGIPVTLFTDFAARIFLPDMNIMLAGGEAIAASGAIVSKVGTATLAELCHGARVRVLIALGSYKFSHETILGRLITIEEGAPAQVVAQEEINPQVKVRNPLFDVTGPEHIDAFITEHGIIPPQGAYLLFTVNQRKGNDEKG
ncbi:MAG: translation initiation factor eIF-2B [Candidatus Hodarchaeota archaeon]